MRENTANNTAVTARLIQADPSTDYHWQLGILLRPLMIEGQLRGEAGQPVRYREAETGIDVVVGVHYLASEVPAEWVIPYHPDYTPSRVFIMLTRKRQVLGSLGSDRSAYLLAWNVAREFTHHPLHEDLVLLACELAEECESTGSKRFPHTRFLVSQYLRAYPRGRYRDRLEWMNVRIMLRREGSGEPLEALRVLRRFLMTHPHNRRRAEIKLAMARLYRIAAEWMLATGEDEHLAGRYLRRARHIYRGLRHNPDREVSQTAQVGLFELEQAA